jgi:TetR/AcrR family transcriptional regulator, repressor for uid operon
MARPANPALAERRRRQIMDAAIACFRRRGFHQATMQEICAEAGISAGALYRYFASKAEIISAIAEDHRSESDVAFLRTAEKSGVVDALCEVAREFFQKFAEGDGALVADIFAEAIRDEALAASLRATDARSVQLFVKAIKAAQARGEVDATLDPEDAAGALFAAIEGIGLRRAFLGDTDPDLAVAQFRVLAERYLGPRR